MAAVSAMAPSWGSLPRLQLGLGVAVFGVVALVTLAPVLVVVAGAFADNVWYETFIGSTANRSAIGYSFLLALRAPVAAFIGFLIAWLLIRLLERIGLARDVVMPSPQLAAAAAGQDRR